MLVAPRNDVDRVWLLDDFLNGDNFPVFEGSVELDSLDEMVSGSINIQDLFGEKLHLEEGPVVSVGEKGLVTKYVVALHLWKMNVGPIFELQNHAFQFSFHRSV